MIPAQPELAWPLAARTLQGKGASMKIIMFIGLAIYVIGMGAFFVWWFSWLIRWSKELDEWEADLNRRKAERLKFINEHKG